MEKVNISKLLFLQNIEDYLMGLGVGSIIIDIITFLTACMCLIAIVAVLNILGGKFLGKAIKLTARKTSTKWDDYLLRRKFFTRVFKLITANIVLALAHVIFKGFSPGLIKATETITGIYIAIMVVLMLFSFLDAAGDVYNIRPAAKHKSIKSYLQAIKIVIAIIGGIFALSILMGKEPGSLLVGLGASAAIISLVFKDTILGFVASIQISMQDLIRPGDWIEVPAKNADGIVDEINLTSVKVRNWNNTVTSIPIYNLVSDSFTNWRNMEDSDGRRFKRPVLIDINSVSAIPADKVEQILADPSVEKYADKIRKLLARGNTSGFVTNMGLYRCYLETYLRAHPKVTQQETSMARYTAPNENGIAIELYGFSNEKSMVEFERVAADIFENAIAMAPLFSLRLYQRSSDRLGNNSDRPGGIL